MQGIIVTRDNFGKPRLWINFRQKANFNELEYLKNEMDKDGIHPLIYHEALVQYALDQIEPCNTIEDVARELKPYYEHFKGELTK